MTATDLQQLEDATFEPTRDAASAPLPRRRALGAAEAVRHGRPAGRARPRSLSAPTREAVAASGSKRLDGRQERSLAQPPKRMHRLRRQLQKALRHVVVRPIKEL